jgi:hypothetical protein
MLNEQCRDSSRQKRVFDHLVPWKRQAAYRLRQFADWFWMNPSSGGELIKGGKMKTVGKLAFVSVDDAGHLPSASQPESVAFIINCWTSTAKKENCLDFDA